MKPVVQALQVWLITKSNAEAEGIDQSLVMASCEDLFSQGSDGKMLHGNALLLSQAIDVVH